MAVAVPELLSRARCGRLFERDRTALDPLSGHPTELTVDLDRHVTLLFFPGDRHWRARRQGFDQLIGLRRSGSQIDVAGCRRAVDRLKQTDALAGRGRIAAEPARPIAHIAENGRPIPPITRGSIVGPANADGGKLPIQHVRVVLRAVLPDLHRRRGGVRSRGDVLPMHIHLVAKVGHVLRHRRPVRHRVVEIAVLGHVDAVVGGRGGQRRGDRERPQARRGAVVVDQTKKRDLLAVQTRVGVLDQEGRRA